MVHQRKRQSRLPFGLASSSPKRSSEVVSSPVRQIPAASQAGDESVTARKRRYAGQRTFLDLDSDSSTRPVKEANFAVIVHTPKKSALRREGHVALPPTPEPSSQREPRSAAGTATKTPASRIDSFPRPNSASRVPRDGNGSTQETIDLDSDEEQGLGSPTRKTGRQARRQRLRVDSDSGDGEDDFISPSKRTKFTKASDSAHQVVSESQEEDDVTPASSKRRLLRRGRVEPVSSQQIQDDLDEDLAILSRSRELCHISTSSADH